MFLPITWRRKQLQCEKPLEEQFSDDELDEAELEEAFARLVGGLGGVVKI